VVRTADYLTHANVTPMSFSRFKAIYGPTAPPPFLGEVVKGNLGLVIKPLCGLSWEQKDRTVFDRDLGKGLRTNCYLFPHPPKGSNWGSFREG
jgi:hypothetical protein